MFFKKIFVDRRRTYRTYIFIFITLAMVFAGVFSFTSSFGQRNALTPPADSIDNALVQIDRIFVIGNKKTKEFVILRELDIKEGEFITRHELKNAVERNQNKLINTSLFLKVTINIIDLSEEKVDIIVRVDERWYIFVTPILELGDRNFTEWWTNQNADLSRVEWGVRLKQQNFRGRNEDVSLLAQFGYTKIFQVGYKIPYVDKAKKTGISVFSDYFANKDIAIYTEDHRLNFMKDKSVLRERLRVSSYITHRPNFYNYHRFGMTYNDTRIADTVTVANPDYFLDARNRQQAIGLSYSITLNHRDIDAYPLKGNYVMGAVAQYGVGIFNDVSITTLKVKGSQYFDLKRHFYLATNLEASFSFPDKQPYANLGGIGFGNSFIRGYELYVIEGQHAFVHHINFKKRLFSTSYDFSDMVNISQFNKFELAVYLSTFYDHGYVIKYPGYERNDKYTNNYIYGFGAGLDFVTVYDLVFRLEYSANKDLESGFRFNVRTAF